ncbi:MAG TPA: GNAT family N-acetyltransferase [Burkholderiaceae bacterium]
MHILSTERLHLRWFDEADGAFVCELLNEPSWLEMIGDRGVRTPEQASVWIRERLIGNYRAQGFGFWAVVRQSDGALLGMCGLVKRDELPEVDIGYAFVPRAWGQGYAREAAAACLRYARETLGLRTLLAITAPHNEASSRLLEAIGLRYIETRNLDEHIGESKLYRWDAPTEEIHDESP